MGRLKNESESLSADRLYSSRTEVWARAKQILSRHPLLKDNDTLSSGVLSTWKLLTPVDLFQTHIPRQNFLHVMGEKLYERRLDYNPRAIRNQHISLEQGQ